MSTDSDICYDPAAQTWLLRMRSTCYALGPADGGSALSRFARLTGA